MFPHASRNCGGTSDTSPPGADDRVAYRIPSGMAVKINGRKPTVKRTMRFLNTSAHSLSTIVRMRFIGQRSRSIADTHLQANDVFRRRTAPRRPVQPVAAG